MQPIQYDSKNVPNSTATVFKHHSDLGTKLDEITDLLQHFQKNKKYMYCNVEEQKFKEVKNPKTNIIKKVAIKGSIVHNEPGDKIKSRNFCFLKIGNLNP
jgi:hypothetical protein